MRTIEIVSHCWATEHPHFAAALTCQLSSLLLYKGDVDVTATICCSSDDERTAEVASWFLNNTPLRIKLMVAATEKELGRRSIMRNQAATGTKADTVWFAD